MRRSLQMHVTSRLSTICNIDITPPIAPTIAGAVVDHESPHHDKIALFCANICKTDSPQLRRLVILLEHSNDPSVPPPSVAAWHPTISTVDGLLEVLFLQTVTDRNDCNGPQLFNIGVICNGEDPSQMKLSSTFRRRMVEYGSGEEEVNVQQMHV